MNKMAIIAGEIATGPGLGSSSVIINKIRQPCGVPAAAPPRRRPRESRRVAPCRLASHRIAPLRPPPDTYLYHLTVFRAQ